MDNGSNKIPVWILAISAAVIAAIMAILVVRLDWQPSGTLKSGITSSAANDFLKTWEFTDLCPGNEGMHAGAGRIKVNQHGANYKIKVVENFTDPPFKDKWETVEMVYCPDVVAPGCNADKRRPFACDGKHPYADFMRGEQEFHDGVVHIVTLYLQRAEDGTLSPVLTVDNEAGGELHRGFLH